MFSTLRAILYRERRRLFFVTVMAYAAGALFYLPAALHVGGLHISLVTGAVYALVVGVVGFAVCAAFPAMRFMIEAVAVSRLLLAVLFLGLPKLGAAVLASPMLTAALVVLGGLAVSRLMHGAILRERRPGWQRWIGPADLFRRTPARVRGADWQRRFVGWLDDAVPIPA